MEARELEVRALRDDLRASALERRAGGCRARYEAARLGVEAVLMEFLRDGDGRGLARDLLGVKVEVEDI
jgi:hypothetical protein